ncbi:hypothetical protein TNCV_2480121 [Trichonephila clavipes]|nr:hypothetical protein TNCV_2480121 [Trichonephila clavipes]
MQLGTTFNSPEPSGSVAGKRPYCRLPLSSKVTGISNIQFLILVHHPGNAHKNTFFHSKTLGKAPVMVCVIDCRPELSEKVATIYHIGYQIQIARLKIRQGPS